MVVNYVSHQLALHYGTNSSLQNCDYNFSLSPVKQGIKFTAGDFHMGLETGMVFNLKL